MSFAQKSSLVAHWKYWYRHVNEPHLPLRFIPSLFLKGAWQALGCPLFLPFLPSG
jgi:hypothetical protein